MSIGQLAAFPMPMECFPSPMTYIFPCQQNVFSQAYIMYFLGPMNLPSLGNVKLRGQSLKNYLSGTCTNPSTPGGHCLTNHESWTTVWNFVTIFSVFMVVLLQNKLWRPGAAEIMTTYVNCPLRTL